MLLKMIEKRQLEVPAENSIESSGVGSCSRGLD
jgi:hypothetical protein